MTECIWKMYYQTILMSIYHILGYRKVINQIYHSKYSSMLFNHSNTVYLIPLTFYVLLEIYDQFSRNVLNLGSFIFQKMLKCTKLCLRVSWVLFISSKVFILARYASYKIDELFSRLINCFSCELRFNTYRNKKIR